MEIINNQNNLVLFRQWQQARWSVDDWPNTAFGCLCRVYHMYYDLSCLAVAVINTGGVQEKRRSFLPCAGLSPHSGLGTTLKAGGEPADGLFLLSRMVTVFS